MKPQFERIVDARSTNCPTPLILLRHGVDENTLTTELNQPLDSTLIEEVHRLGRDLAAFLNYHSHAFVDFWHSTQIRAVQTTEIIASELCAAGISSSQFPERGFRDVYQGKFLISDHVQGTPYKLLEDAWEAWVLQLGNNELTYRFGDPVDCDGKVAFPELTGKFLELGETQAQFSERLYQGFLHVVSHDSNAAKCIVGHQASCSRIQRICSASSQPKSVARTAGEFVKYSEKAGRRLSLSPATGVVVDHPDSDIVAILTRELMFLHGLT